MKKPSLFLALTPVLILIALIILGAGLFGDGLTSGPSQIALLLSATIGAMIAIFYQKIPWKEIEDGITDNVAKSAMVFFILLSIGALTASWVQSGVVPTLIYYGLKLINPRLFLLVIFLFTGIISLMLGSSWTTIGTIGIAMLSAGEILGFHVGWLCGAIISGAYFGDKISPLSDTTNLASSISEVDLYKHIRYMLITNIPTFILTAVIFAVAGFIIPSSSALDVEEECASIAASYNISLWLLLIPCVTIFFIYKKVPAFLTLFVSAVLASVIAVFAQPQIIAQISPYPVDSAATWLYAPLKILSSHIDIATGNHILDGLASTNGMAGMLNTIWLIFCVCAFGGVMEASGGMQTMTEKIMNIVKTRTQVVGSTIFTCILFNLTLSDQYMSIILPGKMFIKLYKKEGFEGRLLSRSLEDSATVTSVLVPWNTCGVAQAGVLGVSTLTYLPYCFFNLLSPVISILITATGYKVFRHGKPVNRLTRMKPESK